MERRNSGGIKEVIPMILYRLAEHTFVQLQQYWCHPLSGGLHTCEQYSTCDRYNGCVSWILACKLGEYALLLASKHEIVPRVNRSALTIMQNSTMMYLTWPSDHAHTLEALSFQDDVLWFWLYLQALTVEHHVPICRPNLLLSQLWNQGALVFHRAESQEPDPTHYYLNN